MPPKKDDKKKGGAPTVAAREIDPANYIRKVTPIPEVNPEKAIHLPRPSGKLVCVDHVFEEWSASPEEVWTEPIAPEKLLPIRYPPSAKIVGSKNFTQFYELDAVDAPVDPKAKGKKEAPKKPAGKGKVEEVVEMKEELVNEGGRTLPVVYRDNNTFKDYPELKEFARVQHDDKNSPFIDPLLCEAFRVISIVGPKIAQYYQPPATDDIPNTSVTEFQNNFLWRSIYPKLPSGKACYNPSGKYCVRLFLAKKWRKVYVDDSIPLREDGRPALAFHNSDAGENGGARYEVWPLLLAKAIYTAYTASGYTFLDEHAAAEELPPSSSTSVADHQAALAKKRGCQFVSFAIHALTGWQPHHFIQRASLFANQRSQSAKILRSMVEVGVPYIHYNDIVYEDGSFFFGDPPPSHPLSQIGRASSENGMGIGSEDGDGEEVIKGTEDGIVMKTKRKFKQEYTERKRIRDEIVAKVIDRENKINRMSKCLEVSSSEVFCIVKYDVERECYQIYPILGLATPDDVSPNPDNLDDVKLLLQWKRHEAVTITPNVDDPIIIGKGRVPVEEFLEPFPKASPLDCQWTTVSHLIEEKAFLIAFFTCTNTAYDASWKRRWTAIEGKERPPTANEKGKKDDKKSKDKKGEVVAPPNPADELVGYQGTPPITFLTLDVREIMKKNRELLKQREQSNGGSHHPHDPDVLTIHDGSHDFFAAQSQEYLEAIAEQESAMNSHAGSQESSIILPSGGEGSEVAIIPDQGSNNVISNANGDSSSSLALASQGQNPTHFYSQSQLDGGLHSVDLIVTLHADIIKELRMNEQKDIPGQEGPLHDKLQPSDTVLVIQEVRMDDRSPLVFVIKMSSMDDLPMVAKTFTITANTLIDLDSHDREHNKDPEPLVFWMKLFTKCSLNIHVHASVPINISEAENEWKRNNHPYGVHKVTSGLATPAGKQMYYSYVEEGDSDVTVDDTEQLLFRLPLLTPSIPESEGPDTRDMQAMLFLHIADQCIEKVTDLMLATIEGNHPTQLTDLSSTVGQVITLSPSHQLYDSVIGIVQPPNRGEQVPKFHWKLIVVSRVPLQTPSKPIRESAVNQSFTGKFIPNNRMCLFRDIYTIDKASFPIAVKLNITNLDTQSFVSIVSNKTEDGGGGFGDSEGKSGKIALGLDNKLDGEGRKSVAGGVGGDEDTGVNVLLRFYRKYDLKLVSEYQGSKLIHCFHQDIAHFLPPPGYVATRPVSAVDPKAKPDPKAKGGKGAPVAAEPAVETIDLIIECVLDRNNMKHIPPSWRSRYPHVYDEFFVPPDKIDTIPGAAVQREILTQQATFLTEKPKETPLIFWEIEMLSGKVMSVSHDISLLQKFYQVKKSWEDATPGRAEQALAAANYVKERGLPIYNPKAKDPAQRTDFGEWDVQSPNATQNIATASEGVEEGKGESSNKPYLRLEAGEVTSTMLENLSLALTVDGEELKKRFTTLHTLPSFEPKLNVIASNPYNSLLYPENPTHAFGSPEWLEAVQKTREDEKVRIEQHYQMLLTKSKEINELYRKESKERIAELSKTYRAQRQEMAQIWELREQYRIDTEKKNASLAATLKRGKEAKAAAGAAEAAAEAERLKQEAKNAKGKKK